VIFVFVMWFWLLVTVMSDLFCRDDSSGFAKVLWVIFLVLLPLLGVFAYLLTQSKGMAERTNRQMAKARDDLRQVVGFSVADELEKLGRMKADGAISKAEYQTLRARAIG
jgi:membrane protein implicated in regulation of membrane protease activity